LEGASEFQIDARRHFVELNQEDLFGAFCSGNCAGLVADYFVVSLSVNFYWGAENAVNNQGSFCSNGND
jgi:hypothetical protein